MAAGLTADAVERGYNNRAAVPEHPVWLARWSEASRTARERYAPRLDLRYGPNPKETLDLFVPSGRARGTLLFIHGGYWRALDKSEHSFVAGPFVEQGLAVAVQNYDLCPEVTVATIVEETVRAVAWLASEGTKHGADASRIVAAGHSAGGHLAALLMTMPAASFGTATHPLAGAVSISGVHDLRPMLLFSFNSDLRLDEAAAARLSPVLQRPVVRAPMLAAVGAEETSEFRRQAQMLWDAWPEQRPAGDRGPLELPGRHHFSIVYDYASAGSVLTTRTLALF